jgi:UDP-GlcNAc:undecaprenyl-phosphate GlcNAc-1-phosphate transferase
MILSFIFFATLCGAAGVLAASIIPVIARMAVRRGWVDKPDANDGGRKTHTRPTPPVGGIVILPLFLLLLPHIGFMPFDHAPLYVAIALITATGWLDDRFDLSPTIKFIMQVLVSILITASGAALLPHLGHLFGSEKLAMLGIIAYPFTAVCFIFFMNALNMIDGIDGLAGGISFVMLFWLGIAALMGGDIQYATAAFLMMAVLSGFLVHNMRYPGHKRATIFLGDAGSMGLAVVIAWLGVNIAADPTPGMPPIGMAWIIALPIIDTFALFISRKRRGLSAFTPGHDHVHHRLMHGAFSSGRHLPPERVTLTLITVVFLMGAIGVLGIPAGIPEWGLSVAWMGVLIGWVMYKGQKYPYVVT